MLAEPLQRLASAGDTRAAPGDDQRPLAPRRAGRPRRARRPRQGVAATGRAAGAARRSGHGRAWMSSGSMSTTGRRSTWARRYARAASATARVRAVQPLGNGADRRHQLVLLDPEVRANRGRGRVGGQHQQRRSALGRLGQAGHGDWSGPAPGGRCTRRPRRSPARRRRPSRSRRPRGAPPRTSAPCSTRALVTTKLPLPSSPKTWRRPTARPAPARPPRRRSRMVSRCPSAGPAPGRGLGCPSRGRSAAARRSAPRRSVGSRARLASWVRPYLPAPSRNEWHGNGGSKLWAAPASVPTVSTPTPDDRRLLGQPAPAHRDARRVRPGLVGVQERRLVVGAASQPLRYSSQPPSGSGPCSRCHSSTCATSSRKSGSCGALGALVDHHRRPDELARRNLGDVQPVAGR